MAGVLSAERRMSGFCKPRVGITASWEWGCNRWYLRKPPKGVRRESTHFVSARMPQRIYRQANPNHKEVLGPSLL